MLKVLKFILFSLIVSANAFANSVSIEVLPDQPLMNEEFEVIFNITTSSGTNQPYISFDPGKAEVRGRRLAGRQSNARFINGKFTTSTVFKYSYRLITDRVGSLILKNIMVEIAGQKIKVPNKKIRIVSQRARPKKFFLRAETSKQNVYIGEGIEVNYYLYSRVQNVGRTEIEIFPKLQSFIKRFYMPKNERQTVDYGGVVYRRSLEYSARVFPEKKGKHKIDPLRLKFQYTDYRNNGFRNFGLTFGRPKVKSLSSKPVQIIVSTIPNVNVPTDFTMLVGEHDFKVSINKNKFLVNEAIEVKFEVTGPGALENFPAPTLYQHLELEEFDAKSELTEINKTIAKKTFEYTYLARGPITFKEKTITFSYFDSITKTFKSKSITLPSVIVGGGAVSAQTSKPTNEEKNNEVKNEGSPITPKISVLAPDFSNINSSLSGMWLIYLRYFLIMLIVLIIGESFIHKLSAKKIPLELLQITEDMKKGGVTYSKLNKYLRSMSHFRGNDREGLTLSEIVETMLISSKCKKYFLDNIQITESMEYNDESKQYNKNFVKKYFNEINLKFAEK